MSSFEVPVIRITKVEDHPNADRLSLVYFRGFVTITAKREDGSHRHAEGDLAIYVPEQAVVPEWILKRYGFWDEAKDQGLLSGSRHNRVKAIRLRGVISQGLVLPVSPHEALEDGERIVDGESGRDALVVAEGDDVADWLGIVKWEPVMSLGWARRIAGNVHHVGLENSLNFDLENILKWPDVFEPDEFVCVTEKLHGTFVQVAYVPQREEKTGFLGGDIHVGSKGQSAKGLMFKADETTRENLYVETMIGGGIAARFKAACDFLDPSASSRMFLVGEIFGVGVQDLGYGATSPRFMAFGIYRGEPRNGGGRFLDREEFEFMTDHAGIERVPLLEEGPWRDVEASLPGLRDGKTTLGADHIREGVVITPTIERQHRGLGRVALKAVSPDYLLRKGEEVTEYA